jgi:hypothetical protein
MTFKMSGGTNLLFERFQEMKSRFFGLGGEGPLFSQWILSDSAL